MSLSIPKGKRRDGFQEDPGFDIIFDAPEFELGEGLLFEQFMDAGWGRLDGEIKNGVVYLTLNAKKIRRKTYELPLLIEALSGIQFSIAIIPLKSKEYWRDIKTLSVGVMREASYYYCVT